jgi:hypothetical protein
MLVLVAMNLWDWYLRVVFYVYDTLPNPLKFLKGQEKFKVKKKVKRINLWKNRDGCNRLPY